MVNINKSRHNVLLKYITGHVTYHSNLNLYKAFRFIFGLYFSLDIRLDLFG